MEREREKKREVDEDVKSLVERERRRESDGGCVGTEKSAATH